MEERFSGKRGPLEVIACEAGRPFALKVAQELKHYLSKERNHAGNGLSLVKSKETHFANSEVKTVIDESVRGADLFIVQDVENPTLKYSVDENLRALKTAADAARRADAHYITAVIPAFPYARQDKSDKRESLTAAQVAMELEECGIDRVITLDLHNSAIAGFFRKAKVEILHASRNIIEYARANLGLDDLTVISLDVGGAKRAEYYAEQLRRPLGIVYKKRDYSEASVVEKVVLLGDVRGKDVLGVDDMIDTAGTAIAVCEELKMAQGAREIHLACSLPLFNGRALEKLDDAHGRGIIKSVIGTDAVYHGENFSRDHPWFREVSVAKYFAKVIYNINNHLSLSALLK